MTQSAENEPLVVGIGASAGGLEAFRELFVRLASDKSLALVLVQHLDPDHKSLLADLLSKRVSTPVFTIEDGMKLEAGAIYLIPPGHELTVADRVLHLSPFSSPRGQRRPIDTFLSALAADVGERAVGIILSGTGSDGSEGIKAIKQRGGLVLAQDPKQAAYDGMPKAAIESGAVDLKLTIEDMADVLKSFHERHNDLAPVIDNDTDLVQSVFRQVRYHTGHDFTEYKASTLLRRIAKRMSVLGVNDPGAYLERLIRDRDEAYQLQQDVLINVTSFFRDAEVFEYLAEEIIPTLFVSRPAGEDIRIWVPGCATGEEAYSLGMLLLSEMEKRDSRHKVTIFGTDIDEEALRAARTAQYTDAVADSIPQTLLDQYMVPTPDGYTVGKRLRSAVRFSAQSLIKDPPFSRLDLISCRNMLIYFENSLQRRALSVFHYALKPGGTLVLGTSEAIKGLHDGFHDVSQRNHVFQRDNGAAAPLDLPGGGMSGRFRSQVDEAADRSAKQENAKPEPISAALIDRHTPPFIVVDRHGDIQRISPQADQYLKLRPGKMTARLNALIRPELEPHLRRLTNKSDQKIGEVAETYFSGEINNAPASLIIRSERFADGDRLFVFSEPDTKLQTADTALHPGNDITTPYINELEQELDASRQTLRTTTEELETSNEELKSSNEEMMSMNEELQSSNEELSTTNDELQMRLAEVNTLNTDLSDFVSSTSLPTVFLDRDLAVRRYTPMATKFFRFVETDLGRPLDNIASELPVDRLLEFCKSAILQNATIEEELTSTDGETEIRVRIVPSLEESEGKRGVVFTLIDVTKLRQTARDLSAEKQAAQHALAEVEELYRVSPAAMALISPDLKYIRVNKRLAEINGLSVKEHEGKLMSEVVPDLGDAVISPVKEVFETGKPLLEQPVTGYTAGRPDDKRNWLVDWYPLVIDGETIAVGVNVIDVTRYREMEEDLTRVMRELQHRVKNMLGNVTALINRARRDDRDKETVLATLFDRLIALGKTHELLAKDNWRTTPLTTLLKSEIADVYGDSALTVRGPEVHLPPHATLSLGMALHELATNAAKYGALSDKNGVVDVRWSRVDEGDGEELRIIWSEHGGPAPAKPNSSGFGSQLIEATIAGSLDGKFEKSWEPSGLKIVVQLPFASIKEGPDLNDAHNF